MDTTENRRYDLKKNYYFLCECARCLGNIFTFFKFHAFSSFIFFFLDQREPIAMNAAACPNKKCNAIINLEEKNVKLPFNCSKCVEIISEKQRQVYKDVMSMTRMHLDKMKSSSIACNFDVLSFFP